MTRRGRMRMAPTELEAEEPEVDLARRAEWVRSPAQLSPYGRPVEHHVVLPPITADQTIRTIAKLLKASSRMARTSDTFKTEYQAMAHLLRHYGIKAKATKLALGLISNEWGDYRGTAHVPNAILRGSLAKTEGTVKDVRDSEVYFRAAYLANASRRIQSVLDAGGSEGDALGAERQYYKAHERARAGRLKAAAQVQTAANLFGQPDGRGTLVGWYLNPLLKNEVECLQANGHNFYAEEGTVIGLPGSVHANCGCYAGSPHQGAAMVNDVMDNVVKLSRRRPAFKLKARRTA